MTFYFLAEAGSGLAGNLNLIFESALEFTLPILKTLAFLIIIWGVLCAAVRLVIMEIKLLSGRDYKSDGALIRLHLGFYLLLGLEFLIALDVLETLMKPDWKELAILAALVVLRTLMGFSLHWELKEIEEGQQEPQGTENRESAEATASRIS